jgi:CheY-like chemotaxis protein
VTRKPSILVADDSSDTREVLAMYLVRQGFDVIEAPDGAEAIHVAQSLHPDFILMDLSMPLTSGWDATHQLKADPQTKDIVIIAITGHAYPADQASAQAAGCDGVLVKPFDLSDLDHMLSRYTRPAQRSA